jgi:hypothetical protein
MSVASAPSAERRLDSHAPGGVRVAGHQPVEVMS